MGAIAITVKLPGEPTKAYRFEELPLLVGRSPTCGLSICHEAVPRRLCRIWLEDQGRAVRVEELPGLTNPLLCAGRPVRGGATGPGLALAIGPVAIEVRPAAAPAAARGDDRFRARGPLIGAAVAAGLLLLVGLFVARPAVHPAAVAALALPDDPLPAPPSAGCAEPAGCRERADLLASRARALLDDPAAPPSARIRAVGLLEHSASLSEGTDPAVATARRTAAERAARELRQEYRRERAHLGRALQAGDRPAATAAAARLSGFLQPATHRDALRGLAALAAGEIATGDGR